MGQIYISWYLGQSLWTHYQKGPAFKNYPLMLSIYFIQPLAIVYVYKH